jgi:hypothetical protein
MDVLDESLEEHEKRWMNGESGNSLLTPCYRDREHKELCSKAIVETEKEDESTNERTHTRMFGGGPQKDPPAEPREEGATAIDRGEGTSQIPRYRLNLNGVRPKVFSGIRQSFSLFYTLDMDRDPAANQNMGRPTNNPDSASRPNSSEATQRPGTLTLSPPPLLPSKR